MYGFFPFHILAIWHIVISWALTLGHNVSFWVVGAWLTNIFGRQKFSGYLNSLNLWSSREHRTYKFYSFASCIELRQCTKKVNKISLWESLTNCRFFWVWKCFFFFWVVINKHILWLYLYMEWYLLCHLKMGWVQVILGVTLNNITTSNNLLSSPNFAKFTVRLHYFHLIYTHANFQGD